MYEKSYGAKYSADVARLPLRDIAALIRADIKAAQTAGDLVLPDGVKVTVRCGRGAYYTAKGSIEVRVRGWDAAWQQCTGIVPGSESADGRVADACRYPGCQADAEHPADHLVMTAAARRVQGVLRAIHAAYNYDGSDIMTDYFDVHYYGNADIDMPRRVFA